MPSRSPHAATPVMSGYCRRDEPLGAFRTNHASICAVVSNSSTVTNSLISSVYISPSRNSAGRARIAMPTGPRSRPFPTSFTRSASCWRSASVDAPSWPANRKQRVLRSVLARLAINRSGDFIDRTGFGHLHDDQPALVVALVRYWHKMTCRHSPWR
jgi:hypothetical protein